MTREVITRRILCKKCEALRKPRRGDIYVIHDGKGGFSFHKVSVSHPGTEHGLTPHFIELVGVLKDKMKIEALCGMDECGITVHKVKDEPVLYDEDGDVVVPYKGTDYAFKNGTWMSPKGDLTHKAYIKARPRVIFLPLKEWKALVKTQFKLL